jgi:uncharacterized integral membrane protein
MRRRTREDTMRRRGDDGFDETPGEEDLPRSGIRPRWIVAGVVAVLLLIFAFQNSERVDVDFLIFDRQVRVISVILISAALGFVVGWFLARPSRAARRQLRRD